MRYKNKIIIPLHIDFTHTILATHVMFSPLWRAGVAGVTGGTGPVGGMGPGGPAGATGPLGPRGDRGEVGAEGPYGPTGGTGGTGPTGPTGSTGVYVYGLSGWCDSCSLHSVAIALWSTFSGHCTLVYI